MIDCWITPRPSNRSGRDRHGYVQKMAANLVRGVISLQAVLYLVLLLGGSVTSGSSDVQDITTENFPNVLEGEWMIEL